MAKQRVALVTGGMGGLGETISVKMADAGYKVAVTYSPDNTTHREWLVDMQARGHAVGTLDAVDRADLLVRRQLLAPMAEDLNLVAVVKVDAAVAVLLPRDF